METTMTCDACGSNEKVGECDSGLLCLRCAMECLCELCAAR